jgi:hypothetical protein
MHRARGDHAVQVAFAPAFPDLRALGEGVRVEGRFRITAHASTGAVTGRWEVAREGGTVRMEAMPDGGWIPRETKPVVRLMYRMVPTFREWPRSYRWQGTVEPAAGALGDRNPSARPELHLRSAWVADSPILPPPLIPVRPMHPARSTRSTGAPPAAPPPLRRTVLHALDPPPRSRPRGAPGVRRCDAGGGPAGLVGAHGLVLSRGRGVRPRDPDPAGLPGLRDRPRAHPARPDRGLLPGAGPPLGPGDLPGDRRDPRAAGDAGDHGHEPREPRPPGGDPHGAPGRHRPVTPPGAAGGAPGASVR